MMRNCFGFMPVVLLCFTGYASAQGTRIHSFESDLEGFFGLDATLSQDTIGATHGTQSMKYEIGAAGFVGARTETGVSASLNDPPGVGYVLFDMTLVEEYTGDFADIGISVFGHAENADPPRFGHNVQFFDTEPIAGKAPGTYTDVRIDFDMSVGPYRPGESFNDIFGPGEDDLTTPSAFQFFVSKHVDPLTVYIDNVRLVVPEPGTGLLLGVGVIAAGWGLRRRR